MIATAVVLYLIGAVLAYGHVFAYQQMEWPELAQDFYERDRSFAVSWCWLSWIALVASLLFVKAQTGRALKHGFKFK